MKSNKIVDQEDQILLSEESSNSTIISANIHTGLTSTSTPIQGLFLQCLHTTVIAILYPRRLYGNTSTIIYLLSSLRVFLPVSLRDDILHHLYKGISATVHLLFFLLTSLQSEFLRLSLLVSLRSGILQSSLLTSLQNKFIIASSLIFLRKIFLRRLYEDIPTAAHIYLKPEILLENIRRFMSLLKQVKPKAPKS